MKGHDAWNRAAVQERQPEEPVVAKVNVQQLATIRG
jgi:hypothetical protein